MDVASLLLPEVILQVVQGPLTTGGQNIKTGQCGVGCIVTQTYNPFWNAKLPVTDKKYDQTLITTFPTFFFNPEISSHKGVKYPSAPSNTPII